MSVRIGNGRIVHASLSRTYDLLMGARPQAATLGRSLHHAWMARHAAGLIDQADLAGETRPAHPLAEAWNSLVDGEREIRATQRRIPDLDFEFELWIFPVAPRRTLIMVHTERREFVEWLDALPFVANHAYWDSVDRPEALSKATWARRCRDWEAALPNGIPSERCLTLVMFNHQYPSMPTETEALAHIPERAERSAPIARVRHIDEEYRRLLADRRKMDPGFTPNGFALLFEATDRANADQARRDAIVSDVAGRLRDIGAEDLAPTF